MLNQVIILLIALILVGMPLMRLEVPWISSPMRSLGTSELVFMKFLVLVTATGTMLAPFFVRSDLCDALRAAVPSAGIPTIIAISLAALGAMLISMMLSRACGAPYAVMGAIFGSQLKVNGSIDFDYAGGMIASWLAAIVLCTVLSAIFSYFLHRYSSKGGRHLILVDTRLMAVSVFATLFLTVAASWNLGQLMAVCPVFVLGGGRTAAFIAVGIIMALFFLSLSSIRMWTNRLADAEMDAGPSYGIAAMLAMGITYMVFSMPFIEPLYLTPAPLSGGALVIASLIGIALVRGDSTVSGEFITKSLAAAMVSPFLGLLLGYCFSAILNVGVASTIEESIIPVLCLIGISLVSAVLFNYINSSKRKLRKKALVLSREEQEYTIQKTLSVLDSKADNTETDLTNKLELKRKELVDFAVGVSEQKAFVEDVYTLLEEARGIDDLDRKDDALDEILSKLRERMYFTHEMKDFYARTEVLHRDFNMRLKEAFPNLTESERKLANLLRQGFSSKYIASLMNITPKSVEISRYRLRNKLGLSRSDNLVQFIKSL